MDTRFQPITSGPPRQEAALEEIRRLFERYRAHPDPRTRLARAQPVQTLPPRVGIHVPRDEPIND